MKEFADEHEILRGNFAKAREETFSMLPAAIERVRANTDPKELRDRKNGMGGEDEAREGTTRLTCA